MGLFDDRMSAARRGYDSRWRRARDRYLALHPFCVECRKRGRGVSATVVDHITPPRMAEAIRSGDAAKLKLARALFWDQGNWQSLCKTCHDGFKQQLERSGVVRGCTADGLPVDRSHHWNT
ncbi:HNH endonuclease signature motif containing protein [Paracandidimonas soli]|uniref:HNH endonuclease signature motif containing protein n=1 Tax=Paracandidimonas soli TaxID=1917182 RepID=UPI001A9D106B|nr:HNH endonuclease signature motif containing protein [Paracandidimonas soli]